MERFLVGILFAVLPHARSNHQITITGANTLTGQVALQNNNATGLTLSFNPTALSFGSQTVSLTTSPQTLTVTNTGGTALSLTTETIAGASSSDFSIAVNTCASSTLAAGATCSMSITFTPSASGSRSASVLFIDNARGAPQAVELSGIGVTGPAASLNPTALNFGAQTVGVTTSPQSVTLTNTGGSALSVLSEAIIGGNSSDFGVAGRTCGITLAPGANCSLSITFTPSATGYRSSSLEFADNAPGSPQAVTLSGEGNSYGSNSSLSLSAASLRWTPQLINVDSSLHTNLTPPQEEIVTNSGSTAVSITDVTISGTNASDWYIWEDTCGGQSIAAGGYCAIFVSFDPVDGGSRSAALQITDNAVGSPQNVRLTGTATAGSQYWVAPNGSDGNQGTLDAPWLTLDHAAHYAYTPGSIINVRGGYYLNQTWGSFSDNGITAAMPVVLRAYPGEVPVITGSVSGTMITTGAPAIVDGLHFEDFSGFALVASVSGVGVFNNTFRRNAWQWIRLDLHAVGVSLLGNTFDSNGYLFSDGEGDAVAIDGAQNVLVQNNYFTRCGHYCLTEIEESGVNIQNIAVVDNSIAQYWGGGLQATGQIPWPKTFFAANRITHVGEGVHYPKDSWFTLGSGMIFRNNVITNTATWFDDSAIGLLAEKVAANRDSPVQQNHVFNNTIYNDGPKSFFLFQTYSAGDSYSPNNTLNVLANNIMFQAGNQTSYFGSCDADHKNVVLWCAATAHPSNPWTAADFPNSNYLLSNLMNAGPSTANQFAWLSPSAYTGYTLASIQSSYPSYFSGNIQGNPLLAAPGNALNGNFTLQWPSPAIAAGTHLTTTTSAGSNTNTVPVADPYYFTDGYGTTPGDMVLVAGNLPVRVLAANYSARTLTVGATVSFSSGATVDLANYNGTAPDMGAFPYSGSSPNIASISATSVNGTSETISWTTNVPTSGELEYGPTTDYGRTWINGTSLSTSHSITVNNLEPSKTYHYAVISVSGAFGRTVSSDQTFTTSAATGPAISNIYVSSMAVSGGVATATISWSTSTSSNSQVFFTAPGAVLVPSLQTPITNPGPSSGVTSHRVTLDPTESFTGTVTSGLNTITVSTTNGLGLLIGQALNGAGIQAGATIIGIGSTSITMNANANASGSESITASGLPLNTTIWFTVQSTDQSTGATSFSPQGMLITPANEAAGPVFSNISISQVLGPESYSSTPPSGEIGYAAVDSTGTYQCCGYDYVHTVFSWTANESLASWTVNFQTNVGVTGEGAMVAQMNSSLNSVPVSGNPTPSASPAMTLYYMPPNTAMVFQLTGTDASGNTTTSPWMMWQTPVEDLQETPVIPPQVFNQGATVLGTTTATIFATTFQPDTCAIEYGTFSSSYGPPSSFDASGTSHSFILTGLTSGTTYHAALICINSSGMSSTWQDFTFTTQ